MHAREESTASRSAQQHPHQHQATPQFYANNQPSEHTEQLHALLENLRSLGATVRLENQTNLTPGAAVVRESQANTGKAGQH